MSSTLRLSLAVTTVMLLLSNPTLALDAACLPYVDAAEKSAQQPARQSVMETNGGDRMEAIVVDDVLYSKMGGKWMKLKSGFWAMERALVKDMRSGEIKLTHCKSLGSETVDGIATRIFSYTMSMPGADVVSTKAYIGSDGLIYALVSDQTRVRYRYQGVRAPQL
jgi:hypothetical protein